MSLEAHQLIQRQILEIYFYSTILFFQPVTVGSVNLGRVFKNCLKFVPLGAEKLDEAHVFVPLSTKSPNHLFKSGRKSQVFDQFWA
jgi:hypothetical protein